VKGFGKSLPPPSAGFAENLYLWQWPRECSARVFE
jgi:hypothetical protein